MKINSTTFRIVITPLVVRLWRAQPLVVISLYVNQDIVLQCWWNSPTSLLEIVSIVGPSILWLKVLSFFGTISHQLGSYGPQSVLEEKINEIVVAVTSVTAKLSGLVCKQTPIQSLWIAGKFLFGKTAKSGAGGGPGPMKWAKQAHPIIKLDENANGKAGKRIQPVPSIHGRNHIYEIAHIESDVKTEE